MGTENVNKNEILKPLIIAIIIIAAVVPVAVLIAISQVPVGAKRLTSGASPVLLVQQHWQQRRASVLLRVVPLQVEFCSITSIIAINVLQL